MGMQITRSGFYRAFAALMSAPFAWGGRRTKPGVWDTPQGQYVLLLRAELERLGYFDGLKEDWDEVEAALAKGHRFFAPLPSRWDTREKRLLQSVRPVYPMSEYEGHLSWGTWRTGRAVKGGL